MMSKKTGFVVCTLSFLTMIYLPADVGAQQQTGTQGKPREGVFEVTLKSAKPRKMIVDELVRDRDLDPGALYRVKTGGYLAFDEAEWVKKIEFKVFEKPVTELPQYKRFSELIVDINTKIGGIKRVLGSYDQLALRLMNICDKSRFPTLSAIDENVVQQVAVYQKLELLRQLVVNALDRFIRDRSCVDRYAEYSKSLDLYSRRLGELSQNYDRLSRSAIRFVQDLKSSAGQPAESEKTEEQPPPPPSRPPSRR